MPSNSDISILFYFCFCSCFHFCTKKFNSVININTNLRICFIIIVSHFTFIFIVYLLVSLIYVFKSKPTYNMQICAYNKVDLYIHFSAYIFYIITFKLDPELEPDTKFIERICKLLQMFQIYTYYIFIEATPLAYRLISALQEI